MSTPADARRMAAEQRARLERLRATFVRDYDLALRELVEAARELGKAEGHIEAAGDTP